MQPPSQPHLRPSITGQVDVKDTNFVLLYDGLRLSRQLLRLRRDVAPILGLFDGTRTITDVQMAILPHTRGRVVPTTVLKALTAKLDEALFLESNRMAARRDEFLRHPVREPTCFHDEDPRKLQAELNNQFVRKGGPGQPATP